MELEYLSIEEILNIIKKYLKLIIGITIFTTVISFILAFFIITPKYTVYTKVFIGKQNGSEPNAYSKNYANDDVEMYQKLLKTYCEIIKTNSLVEKAVNKYNISHTPSEILEDLKCTPAADTQILKIEYTNSNIDESKKIISAITDEFIKEAEELIPNGKIKAVENVIVPQKPSFPNKNLFLAGGFGLGLFISFLWIFFIEFFDNTFKTKEKLERITGLPVLGAIPDQMQLGRISRSKKSNRYKRFNNMFIVESNPTSIVAEAYRTLQTNIEYSSDKYLQTILITSAELEEGKSTIAGNLSLAFAEGDKKVIIIDCDLRNPTLHKKFNISNETGLSDAIKNCSNIRKSIANYNGNLYVMPSGKSFDNPATILASSGMDNVIDYLKKYFDVIILDSAPILTVTDANILSTKVDGTLMVVRAGMTTISSILEAKNLLQIVDGTILGTVLHSIDFSGNKNTSQKIYDAYYSKANEVNLEPPVSQT